MRIANREDPGQMIWVCNVGLGLIWQATYVGNFWTSTIVNSRHQFLIFAIFLTLSACADPEGGTGGPDPPPPLENYKNIGFLSNTGPDPLKITKLPIQHSIFGHHRPASKVPFKRVIDHPLCGIWILPPLIKLKKIKKKTLLKLNPL